VAKGAMNIMGQAAVIITGIVVAVLLMVGFNL
jgi:hypothetical protein